MRRFIREEANKIAIFGADNWLGYVVAWAILNLYHKRKFSVRVIVRDENAVQDLRKLGAEISTIDYDHDETIDSALTGVNTVIFAPEVDHQRIDDSKKLAESMKRVNLVNIVTLSILGAGDSKEQTLTDYREIEKAIEGTKSRWVTLRPALLSERFLHYEKRIKEKHILSLNVHSDSRWSPLNLKDLIETISVICFDNGKLRDAIEHKHLGKRYTLTGPEALTGPLIVDTINYVIGQQNIEFIEIEREEHKKYLQSLGNDEPNDMAFGKRNKNRYPPPPPPNDIEIELILDFYDYVKTGNANYVSGDFNSITHEDPQRLLYFIEENSKSFKSNPTEYRSRL